MIRIIDNPYIVFALSLAVQCVAAYLGDLLRRKVRPVAKKGQADFDIVLSATLTLLALIIGFTFAMAVSRYDQRKNLEAEEANAIGTEYLRADLLPAQIRPRCVNCLVAMSINASSTTVRSRPPLPAATQSSSKPSSGRRWCLSESRSRPRWSLS